MNRLVTTPDGIRHVISSEAASKAHNTKLLCGKEVKTNSLTHDPFTIECFKCKSMIAAEQILIGLL